jgi:general secretion pathway protein K
MKAARGERGVVLLVVLFFSLLLSSSIVAFVRRSTVDSMIARNRDNAARADALARGGVRLAQALLVQDRLLEQTRESPLAELPGDPWARARNAQIQVGGGVLRLRIEDSGARLNLNSLIEEDDQGEWAPRSESEDFLIAALEKVIDEMPLPPGERSLYDPRELAANLLDYLDADEVRLHGGEEDDYYQTLDPPYHAANGPLLSVDELRMVEGFDAALVKALRPYVTVYPFAPGGCFNAGVGCGINLNTAPSYVLALLYYDDGVDVRLATEDVVRQLLQVRQEGGGICEPGQSPEACTPIGEIVTNAIFPPPTISSDIFVVTADAQVGDVTRRVEAVVDRSQLSSPRLLSWRLR